MKSLPCFVALFSLSLLSSTAAHGWISTLTVAGTSYAGNLPLEQTPPGAMVPSPIRQIANILPVKNVASPDLACGRVAATTSASEVAHAAPGDAVLVHWATVAGTWFHEVGPMMAYLARCGTQGCAVFDATKASWFKIVEEGMDGGGVWAQASLESGSPAKLIIPRNLAPGDYLLRHEIVALHTAQSLGGAEFYVGCAQLRISGNGTSNPEGSELVRFPGAYGASDKGILVDVYNLNGTYQFLGPPVAALVEAHDAPFSNTTHVASTAAARTMKHATNSTFLVAAARTKPTTHAMPTPTCVHTSPSSGDTTKAVVEVSRSR
ncbi:glycoside hydrolase family 61 protein [Mycena polygramma]|nr:glycoside hydrolase family 61 protein [Mycena polygramma]